MSYFCSFPPKFTFPRCSEEFLFPLTKIQNIYHIDNQFLIFLSQFHDYPYNNRPELLQDSNDKMVYFRVIIYTPAV